MAEFSLYCIFGEKIGEKTNQGLRDPEQENKEKQGKTRKNKKKKPPGLHRHCQCCIGLND